MAVQQFSEMTYWSGLSLRRLGCEHEANELFQQMILYAAELENRPAKIDYFATSLPTLLLFEDDLEQRLKIRLALLRGAAMVGLGERDAGSECLEEVLRAEPSCLFAIDLLEQIRSTQTIPSVGPS